MPPSHQKNQETGWVSLLRPAWVSLTGVCNYWFKHIPYDLGKFDFEKWREKRIGQFNSPRNCFLTWFKRGIVVPLQFSSLEQSARIMGNLFGRDAAKNIIETEKLEWSMSLGITLNTKQEIDGIILNQQSN